MKTVEVYLRKWKVFDVYGGDSGTIVGAGKQNVKLLTNDMFDRNLKRNGD